MRYVANVVISSHDSLMSDKCSRTTVSNDLEGLILTKMLAVISAEGSVDLEGVMTSLHKK